MRRNNCLCARNDSVEDAMTARTLGQYFRAFLVKLAMADSQLAPMIVEGDLTFAIVLELRDNMPPSAKQATVRDSDVYEGQTIHIPTGTSTLDTRQRSRYDTRC